MHMLPQPVGSAAAHHPFSKRHIYLIDLLQPVYMWQQWPLSGSTGFTACWQNPAFQERHICGVLSTDLDQQIDPWALGKGRDTVGRHDHGRAKLAYISPPFGGHNERGRLGTP